MGFNERETDECERLLRWGLAEDLNAAGDITSAAVIPADCSMRAVIRPRHAGVVAGLPSLDVLARVAEEMLPDSYGSLAFEALTTDGPTSAKQSVARVSGSARAVLAVERTMLNLLCRLSGIATLTAKYVEAVQGTSAVICDTRKTTPGWRHLEKYAVRIGGGTNHRTGLFDAVLIKDNHLAEVAKSESNPIPVAIQKSRDYAPAGTIVEVEVDSLEQLAAALASTPDIVLLDNMTPPILRKAVAMRDAKAPSVQLEASGGVHLETVADIADAGVDRISVGALTHSPPALDLGLDDEATL